MQGIQYRQQTLQDTRIASFPSSRSGSLTDIPVTDVPNPNLADRNRTVHGMSARLKGITEVTSLRGFRHVCKHGVNLFGQILHKGLHSLKTGFEGLETCIVAFD